MSEDTEGTEEPAETSAAPLDLDENPVPTGEHDNNGDLASSYVVQTTTMTHEMENNEVVVKTTKTRKTKRKKKVEQSDSVEEDV